jgi:acetyl esterase/lipase
MKSCIIDKDLRITGLIMKIFPRIFFTESGLRLLNKLSNKRWIRIKDETMQFTEEWIHRKDGSKLRICIFKPLEAYENVPGILWLHGGGYAIGAPEQSGVMVKRFMAATKCVIVAPDYRLSIQDPYPAALEDSYETLLWIKDHTHKLGIRDNQLMVGGESAGGGLAAALTLYARDKGEVAVAFQMPLYPMLDDRMTSQSAKDNRGPVWNSNANFNAWKLYLGKLFGTTNVPYYAAPARASDYSNLPPTVTFVGELDPFRDETNEYVENLRKAGVPVDFEIYKGCYHAFEQMCPKAEISKRAIAFLMKSYQYAVKNYYAAQKE